MAQHPHIIVPNSPDPVRFTSPYSGREKFSTNRRADRVAHANTLLEKLEAARVVNADRVREQKALGLDEGLGISLTFESVANFELKFESLDVTRSGIELCAVKKSGTRYLATVFIPDGKLSYFLKKIEAYRDKDNIFKGKATGPKNEKLIANIADIRLAALEAFWTEPETPFPAVNQVLTWEVWLRHARGVDQVARLREHAQQFDLTVGQEFLSFVDRQVILVRGTAEALSRSAEVLGMIAELRLPKETAAFFTAMTAMEQQQWVENLAARVAPPNDGAPYVCLLDSGLNHEHPLLQPVTDAADVHTYRPAWGTDDRHNHGTPMAGLAVYGDLTEVLEARTPVPLSHRLESVKIYRDPDANDPDLYGAVTRESVYRVEQIDRTRVFCMAVSSKHGRDRGHPTSWSAAVDALSVAGEELERPRLFIVSAGNTVEDARRFYPNSNATDSIHDPAQSWNAITVGGYTTKALIDAAKYPGWSPLAQAGDLSPCSCTSMGWQKGTALKPDIVMEAGNMGKNAAHLDPDYIDDRLQLLSLHRGFLLGRPFTTFGDTSAATALASRLAASVWAKYPNLRPETVRALMIHSAEWTPEMLARFTEPGGNIDYKNLVRCFGRGVPNLRRLLSSLDNSLTLLVESEIKPFYKDEDDNGGIKTREMRIHPLPWPREQLAALGRAQVAMKVTLSYFVEPSPGSRGWTARYGYQSHGLRFGVRNPLENEEAFQRRVNKYGRDEDYQGAGHADPGWDFGFGLRALTSAGSVHCDVWRGTAAQLAERGHIAVYPTMGWWNKRPHLEGWMKSAPYSLVVTIETPEVDADLYTPVAAQIGIPVEVEV